MVTPDRTGTASVLVVDDSPDSRELLGALLESAGYRVWTAADGREGLRSVFANRPDLVLVDVVMPNMDGWELLGRIRDMSDTPVMMLTALGAEEEKVRGLRSGADDYLVKPFGRAELLARVGALLRRTRPLSEVDETYTDPALHIDFGSHEVYLYGRRIQLTPLESRMLAALVKHAGIVLSAGRLIDLCWGGRPAGPANVRVYIGYLRRKLQYDPDVPQLIETVREFGYRYRPPPDGP